MASTTLTFNVSTSSYALSAGEEVVIRLQINSVSSNNFTASLSQGNLTIRSLSTQTGYATTACPYLSSASIAAPDNTNDLVFSSGISGYYNSDYTFVPNPLSGSASSSLYPIYGDVTYPFTANPFDIVLIYLSDGTYNEYRILDIYDDNNGLLRFTLDQSLSSFVKQDLALGRYKRILILTRIEDETNAYLTFSKRPGQTSYGFLIPKDLAPDILTNINTITKQVKQKLLADQQGATGG